MGLATSSAAPVSDWLRMRQAIVRPLNSMLPGFKSLYSNLAIPRHVIAIRTHRRFDNEQSAARSVPRLTRESHWVQYAEKALGNRDYFLNKPNGVG